MKTLVANRNNLVLILVIVLTGFSTQGSYGQTITASVQQPLTEANLHGSVVTLTLSGRSYARSGAVTVSGIEGITLSRVRRVSDIEVTATLVFSGNIDTEATLTFTVEANLIAGYNQALTVQVPVTAVAESLVASTVAPLTEATLSGSVVTLTLSGRVYEEYSWYIADALTVSGIDGISVGRFDVDRVSDTEATVELTFFGNIDTDATLTLTVGADAIIGYNQAFTFQFPVTAVEESLVASTEFPLTEATLDGSVVTLTLSGRVYEEYRFQIEDALTVSGIDGVALEEYSVDRVSDTVATVELTFSGDFDTDATLTFTHQEFTAQISVTAIQKSNATVSISPASVVSPDVGEQLTFSLNIAGGVDVAGYQATVLLDSSALYYYMKSANGDYLPADAFFRGRRTSYPEYAALPTQSIR